MITALSGLYLLAWTPPGRAACTSIPPAPPRPNLATADAFVVTTTTTTTTMLFRGRIGSTNVPFVVPGVALRIQRGACDQQNNQGSPFPAAVRTIIVIDPKVKQKSHALIIEPQGQGACSQATIDACDEGIYSGHPGDVTCVDLPPSQYFVDGGGTTLAINDFPDLDTLSDEDPNEPHTRAGPMKIAVTSESDLKKVCKGLLSDTACVDTLKSTTAGWHACVDQLFEDQVSPPCQMISPDDTFPSLTLLPKWNDLSKVCFTKYCTGSRPPLDQEFRYAIDEEENILIPMYWKGSLDLCQQELGQQCGVQLTGALIPPKRLEVPPNDTTTTTVVSPSTTSTTLPGGTYSNIFLQSFRPEGSQIVGVAFGKDNGFGIAVALKGRTDGPYSVLRLPSTRGQCEGLTERCNRKRDCPSGVKCLKQGSLNRLRAAFKQGRWRLDRNLNVKKRFCEATPPMTRCSQSAPGCTCVTYQLTATDAFYVMRPPLRNATVRVIEALAAVLEKRVGRVVSGQKNTSTDLWTKVILASDSSGRWLAVYISESELGVNLDEHPEKQDILAVARVEGCPGQAEICDLTFPDVGPVQKDAGVSVVGTKVRFFTPDPTVAPPPRGLWQDLRRWFVELTGGFGGSTRGEEQETKTRYPLLQIYDAELGLRDPEHNHVTPVTRVDLSDDRYTPLRDYPNGGTLFLSPSGRCVSDGRTAPVPEQCQPDSGSENCPAPTTCVPTSVVVATDLTTDRDSDGVPDALKGPYR